jgi:hypothetical protein
LVDRRRWTFIQSPSERLHPPPGELKPRCSHLAARAAADGFAVKVAAAR